MMGEDGFVISEFGSGRRIGFIPCIADGESRSTALFQVLAVTQGYRVVDTRDAKRKTLLSRCRLFVADWLGKGL